MRRDHILDGDKALEDVLGRGRYGLLEVVAKYTVFLHPDTVKQMNGEALFRIARAKDSASRGCIIPQPDGSEVVVDDNTSPTRAFEWAAQQQKGRRTDVQFNHIYNGNDKSDLYRSDPDIYTALWNICVTPAFLAKLTDTHKDVIATLRRRLFDLYDCLPEGEPEPEPPDGYDSLTKKWHEHPPPVCRLEDVLRDRLKRAPKSNPAESCRKIGWCFSGWEPDHALHNRS